MTKDGVRVIFEKPGFSEGIQGVFVTPLRRIPDERGTIMHVMSANDPRFRQFGEIYASTVYKDAIKAWHLHSDMTLNYACLHGRVKCALYDDRAGSPTRGVVMEVFLGPDNYALLSIPPNVWNGFKGLSDPISIVVNCCTHAHDPARSQRSHPHATNIPYDWARKDH